jgi:hypothetical protein
MRLTIIPTDGTVIIDGVPRCELSLSSCNIPNNVHALQWYDIKGWIEFQDPEDPFTPKSPNQEINNLPEWAIACIAVWEAWVPPAPPEPPVVITDGEISNTTL